MSLRPRPITVPAPTLSLADITERLFARLGGRLGPVAIARVVRQCHRELEIVHGPVPAEALESLAYERLRPRAASGAM